MHVRMHARRHRSAGVKSWRIVFKEWDYKKPNIALSHYHLFVACQNEQDILFP